MASSTVFRHTPHLNVAHFLASLGVLGLLVFGLLLGRFEYGVVAA
ncbi:MAG: hypothetical protein U5L04_10245 [Trueperaceae bacterium]|nr:hypothetical protein [Trueperaceae bacterium]